MKGRQRIGKLLALLFLLCPLSVPTIQAQVLLLPTAQLHPRDGETVIGRRPTLRVMLTTEAPPFVPEQLFLGVDGFDVSSQLEIEERTAIYRPASDLKPGSHSATLIVTDPFGKPIAGVEWSFSVRDYTFLEEGSLGLDLTGTFQYAPDKLRDEDPGWSTQNNIGIVSRAFENPFESTLNMNIHAIEQEGKGTGGPTDNPVDLADWHFMTRYEQNRIDVGDLQLSETFFLTGDGFARRGIKGSAALAITELGLFALQTQPTIGFENMTGVQDPDNRAYGVSFAVKPLPDDALTLKAVYLDGENQSADAFNIGSVEDGMEGSTYSFAATSSLFEGRLTGEAEGAFSDFDDDTADQFGKQRDNAWRVKVGGTVWKVDLEGEYKRIGSDFGSIANPSLVNDRQGLDVAGTLILEPANLSLGFSQFHDNVDDDPLIPRITEGLFTTAFDLAVPDYPTFNVGYSRSDQDSSREPPDFAPFRVVTDTVTGSLWYGRETWSASLATYYSLQDTKEDTLPDTSTLDISLGGDIRPVPSISLAPTFTFTQVTDRDTDISTDTYLTTLTANAALIPDVLIFDTQGSYTRTLADDGSVDQWNVNVLGRLAFNFGQFLINYGSQTLSVNVIYNRTVDDVVPTNSVDEVGVFLTLEIFAPVRILPLPR